VADDTIPPRPCHCGSSRESWELYDARGIYCCRVCTACEERQRSRYRKDVLDNPNYDCDEPIEPDDY
jgi:hypothetical protein